MQFINRVSPLQLPESREITMYKHVTFRQMTSTETHAKCRYVDNSLVQMSKANYKRLTSKSVDKINMSHEINNVL